MNRERLRRVVGAMSAILVVAFIWVFFSGLFTGSSSVTDHRSLNNIAPGHTVMSRINQQRAWVTVLSDAQRRQLEQFDDAAVVTTHGCQITEAICVILAATARAGIELRFVDDVPAALPEGLPWAGGFVNPDTGAVYDLIGRAYAFQGEVNPLRVLDVR